MKVAFSQNAEQDLEGIADWVARDNPERGYAFVDTARDPTLRRRIYGIHGARDYAQIVFANDEPG